MRLNRRTGNRINLKVLHCRSRRLSRRDRIGVLSSLSSQMIGLPGRPPILDRVPLGPVARTRPNAAQSVAQIQVCRGRSCRRGCETDPEGSPHRCSVHARTGGCSFLGSTRGEACPRSRLAGRQHHFSTIPPAVSSIRSFSRVCRKRTVRQRWS